jgi:predicted RND superfamily exporter protein
LGLGIDYSIHLQKRYEIHRKQGQATVDAWLNSIENLALPLSLAVITTVAAFMANLFSPLPALKSFGISLALGVVNAFFCSTIIVGCLHVVGEKISGGKLSVVSTGGLGEKFRKTMKFQSEQKAIIMIVTGLLTLASLFGAMMIKTEFDLTDFLDEDMPVMEVRENIQNSYDYASIQLIYVLIEPEDNLNSIEGGETLLDTMQYLDETLPHTKGVVKPSGDNGRPQYQGIYAIIRDALEVNPVWGEDFNLKLYGDEIGKIDSTEGINLGLALGNLSENNTVGDPLTGSTWAERVSDVAIIDSTGNILKLRISIYVNSGTNVENSVIVSEFEDRIEVISSQLSGLALIHLTGDMVKIDAVLTGMTNSQIQSTSISLLVSLLVLMLLTRQFTPALVVIAPVGVAAFWVIGSMAALGLQWNVLTIMVTALTIGIGIDYSIHVWRRFEEELKQNKENKWEAMNKMHSSTGLALLMSAGTTICGFAVLTLSPMPVVREFGLITSLTVFYSVILSLVVLPVLLVESKENSKSD